MDSNKCIGGSERLTALARQLRMYKPTTTTELNNQGGVKEQRIKNRAPAAAAVLVCIFEGDDGDLRVILTKRASRLSTHSGEVALPGGKAEEGDADEAETATREAKEEIGLDPSLVKVVALLEPFLSKHLFPVTPVIGLLFNKKAFSPVLNAAEVEAVFDAPLEMFIKGENWRAEELDWNGGKYMMHYFNYEADGNKYVIWGLTSEILIMAASVVYQRPLATLEMNSKSNKVQDSLADTL